MKITNNEIKSICEKVVKSISNYIMKKIAHKHLYTLDVEVNLNYLEKEEKYVLDVYVYLDINPFIGVNANKLIEEAIERGFEIAKSELRKYDIEEIEIERKNKRIS